MNLEHDKVDFVKISTVDIPDEFYNRIKTGNEDLDCIFGEGILPGSTITLIAKAGTGKSRFCLGLAETLIGAGYKVGYATGEEGIEQLAYTCKTMGVKDVLVSTETDVDILASKLSEYNVMIVDSFQCLTTTQTLNREKKKEYFINTLIKKAKETKCALIVIVHMTVAGEIKGGTLLPHSVDVNLRIDKDDSFDKNYRIITNYKNRFGVIGAYGANMTPTGYEYLGEIQPESESSSNEPKPKKVSKQDQRKEIILKMIDPPHITMERVMKDLDIGRQTAYNLLRDLESSKQIEKFGRGETAIWKNKTVDTKSFAKTTLESFKDVFKI